MIYKDKFKIGIKDVTKDHSVTNKAILQYLEDIAEFHSDSIGCGIISAEKTNLNWLLLDWKVEVIKRPKYGQILEVHTWSRNIVKCFAYRDFEIYDDENNLCVIASSKWVLVNTKIKKVVKVDEETIDKYLSEPEHKVFENEFDVLKEPSTVISKMNYKVTRRDLDVIGHMHNIYYLDVAYEALPEDVYQNNTFNKFRIMYKKEMKYKSNIICKYTYENNKHIVTFKDENDEILHSVIELYN